MLTSEGIPRCRRQPASRPQVSAPNRPGEFASSIKSEQEPENHDPTRAIHHQREISTKDLTHEPAIKENDAMVMVRATRLRRDRTIRSHQPI